MRVLILQVSLHRLKDYIKALSYKLPSDIYEGIIMLFIVGLISALSVAGIKRGTKICFYLLLCEYYFLVLCSTVIYREPSLIRKYSFLPFWSYREIADGREELVMEVILNILLFVPIGILLAIVLSIKCWIKILFIALFASTFIELLQLLSKRGFCEFDDVIHNTFGCMIGLAIYATIYGSIDFYNSLNI
jgi:glycopeptide antibiotics resistance protein